jgi:hypothetical protein
LVVYNWDLAEEVLVDLSSAGLGSGSFFEIRDVQNLKAPPIVSGTYSGNPVTIPLDLPPPAPIIGWEKTPETTAPEFAVFLVTTAPEAPSRVSRLLATVRSLVGW